MSQQTIDLDTPDQPNQSPSQKGPVTCLGKTFDNDEARRAYFTELLREKLKDPEFRQIEGFPIGEDEDILNLSDPPYYTACPNPWIADFIAEWEAEKPEQTEPYHREPFAADVSEGKNHPIYNAHSYHTKVPHRAIMRYILHYTQPGDIVFDGFCGTGMTGVAAQLCGDREEVLALGYQIQPDGTILQQEEDENGKQVWKPFSKLGARKAVLNDLSPAATFIAYNYNTPVDVAEFEKEAKRILKEVEDECGWMYETIHTDGKTKGKINYTVWSDVFSCPNCGTEIVYFNEAVKIGKGVVESDFQCPSCSQWLSKSPAGKSFLEKGTRQISEKVERVWEGGFDNLLKTITKTAKQVPVLISYSIKGKKFKKAPNNHDLMILKKIVDTSVTSWVPIYEIPKGDKTNDPFSVGIKNVHQFYSKRNLIALSKLWQKLPRKMKWIATSFLSRNLTKCNRFVVNSHNPNGRINGPLTGTFYIPSESVEQSALELFEDKIIKSGWKIKENLIQTGSSTDLNQILDESIDYIFIDPPFGANIMYSELSFLWESWLAVFTNNKEEAIENKSQNKSNDDYRVLMQKAFMRFLEY